MSPRKSLPLETWGPRLLLIVLAVGYLYVLIVVAALFSFGGNPFGAAIGGFIFVVGMLTAGYVGKTLQLHRFF